MLRTTALCLILLGIASGMACNRNDSAPPATSPNANKAIEPEQKGSKKGGTVTIGSGELGKIELPKEK